MPLHADWESEAAGLDVSVHGEEAYVHAEGATALSAVNAAVGGHKLIGEAFSSPHSI